MCRIFTLFSSLLLVLFFASSLHAQRSAFRYHRFGSSVFLGGNFSQIAGDGHHGYDYPGLALGLRGTVYFNWRMDFSVSLGYSRRGAKPPLGFSTSTTSVPWQQNTRIRTDYATLGFWWNWHLYPNRAPKSRMTARFGLLYGYAFSIRVRQNKDNNPYNDYDLLLPVMSRNDVSLQAGLVYYFSPKLGFGFSHSLQLLPLYKKGRLPDSIIPTLRQFHIQFGFEYIISPERKLLERRRTPPWVDQ